MDNWAPMLWGRTDILKQKFWSLALFSLTNSQIYAKDLGSKGDVSTVYFLGEHRLQNHRGYSNFGMYQLHPFCIPHSSWPERSIKPQEENGYSVSHNAGVHLPLWEEEIMKTGKTIKVAHWCQPDIPRPILRKVKRPLGIWLQLRRWAR